MENILLNSSKTQIKIVDFGLSNIYSPDCPLRTHCGSPEYAAPELFLAGRHYGPEVDLWSLGVILYGMVTGQLPFLTSREEHLSSQERRRKLLIQINKGLSVSHRKLIGSLSADFKSLLSRLLVPDPNNRIQINELLKHPWVTEQGKKIIRINPLGRLDEYCQTIIIQEVSKLAKLEVGDAEFAINTDPYGNLGGMFNIMAYRRLLHRTDGDGICCVKTLPNTIISTEDSNKSHTEFDNNKNTVTIQAHHFPKRPLTSQNPVPSRPPSVKQESRPSTAQTIRGITKHPPEQWTADMKESESKLHVVGSHGVSRPYNNLTNAVVKTKTLQIEKVYSFKKQKPKTANASLPSYRSKSEPLPAKPRPVTTIPKHTIERPLKRKRVEIISARPVTYSISAPNKSATAAANDNMCAGPAHGAVKKIQTAKVRIYHQLAAEKKAGGDMEEQITIERSSASKRFANEPIARSVAGYFTNNVPTKVSKVMQRLQLAQKIAERLSREAGAAEIDASLL